MCCRDDSGWYSDVSYSVEQFEKQIRKYLQDIVSEEAHMYFKHVRRKN